MSYESRYKMSDLLWAACSKPVEDPDDGTYVAVRIPRNTFVKTVRFVPLEVGTVGDVAVGFADTDGVADDDDAFIPALTVDPTSLASFSSEEASGMFSGGRYFTQPGSITFTTMDDYDGSFQIFVEYAQLKN